MLALLSLFFLLTACDLAQPSPDAPPAPVTRQVDAQDPVFPAPDRPVADIVTGTWSDDRSRDESGEVTQIIRILGIHPGQTIADIGAGSGYYSVRLSPAVGPKGRIYANDIIPDYLARLRARAKTMGLTNVETILGQPGNTNLPDASLDIALMVHMYHEIGDPFGLLWHLHESLKPGAKIAIIDADRPTQRHGTPTALLKCELAAAGFNQVGSTRLGGGSYMSVFEPVARPEPDAIKPCPAT